MDPIFLTPGHAMYCGMAIPLSWLDEGLRLERLPHSELFDERDDEPTVERIEAHLPRVLEDLGLL